MKLFRFGLLSLLSMLPLCANDVLVEAKAGYFYPTSSNVRDVYSNGGGIYGLEISAELFQNWYGFVSGDWFGKSGHSEGLHNKTRMTLVPVAFGLKYLGSFNDTLDGYLGIGVQANYLHLHDQSPYVVQRSSKWGWGGVTKAGLLVNLPKKFFFDIFASYSWIADINFSNNLNGAVTRIPVNTDGLSVGIGLGYRFGCKGH